MSAHRVIACASCPGSLHEALCRAFAGDGPEGFVVEGTDCMNACARGPTLAFRAPGKAAWLFGDLGPANLSEILAFARLYAAASDGMISDARPLGALRFRLIGRIPG